MRPSTIAYILKQGIKNIKRNWMFSAASILTMSACIFLFGIFLSIVSNLNYIAKSTEEKVPITVFFDEGISQEEIDAIGEQIKTRPEVESIVYQSAEEAWEKFQELYFPEDSAAAEGFKDDNPLIESSNYQISLNDLSKQAELVSFIESIEGVRKIEQAEKAAETLSSVSNIVYYVSAVVIGILLLISVFLISNTVSVGISVRGEEIGIMKYIGATDRFVRAPFVLEGMILGAVGAIIPLVAMFFVYTESVSYILTRYSVLSGSVSFLSVYEISRVLIPVSLILGIGIGLIGSFWTTRKHLRV